MTVEPPPSRFRPAVVGPVLIAAIFLAVIGASVGFVLAGRESQDNGGAADGPDTVYTTPTAQPDDPPAAQPPPPPDDDPLPVRDRCPRHTERWAKQAGSPGGLELKLYIRTDGSEVWICRDSAGTLFYQGHRGSPGERLVEGKNALFLADVVADGDGYLATNRSGKQVTTYRVSTAQLVIESPNGTTTEDVRDHWP
ncbi:MAG TPA: hypothetical protein VFR67_14525 [Pilimelia sp.]|nr:hypothetical protein [Pilimelia sp.]